MGGIEPNTIYTIAGISGSGKSSFANSLETDLFDLNPEEDFVVLSFNFEMLASKQVGRKLSYKMKKTTSELYAGDIDAPKVDDNEYRTLLTHAEEIKQYPIYYVDSPGTVEEVRNTIIDFYAKPEIRGKWLIIMFDHTLLTRLGAGEKERETLFKLQKMFMEIKKYAKNTIIQLSQMNREIEDKDRISNPVLHYPIRRDIFGGDSVFQASDYVIVLHRPEVLGIAEYGLSRLPTTGLIFMHFLKVREGEPKILVFENNLKYNSIDEVNNIKSLIKTF
jgi:replicative DNA helicase